MRAEWLTRRAANTNAAHDARCLDLALEEYCRRYGDARFTVTGMKVTSGGIEFTVVVQA